MKTVKLGLLPLYLKLYDDVCKPELTNAVRSFAEVIRNEYQKRDVEIVDTPICRINQEFSEAIKMLEAAEVDAIVTLHLAYSPSLESIEAFAKTDLPLIILDTTPDYDFGFSQQAERIMFNHGIHGVQDFCNLLIRYGKTFTIEAGHWEKSNVIDRTIATAKGYCAANAMRKSRVGIIGEPFRGMGDFAVPFDVLKKEIGLEVVSASSEDIAKLMPELDSEPVKAETAKDIKRFKQGEFTAEALAESESACLAVGKWLEAKKLNAFTMNFQNITGAPGLPVVPFLEASKAMARGIGYGGEGDVLTAALCGALAQVIPETTFTEMFCPDWQEERIFLSHMGEINTDLAVDPELNQRPYPYSAAGEPVLASGCLKAGNGWLVNVAPGPDNTFSLITAPVEVCDTNGQEAIDKGIRGWIKPQIPLSDFLEKYSRLGGTHHKVLCYNADEATLKAFAARMGWSFHVIL